MSLDTAYVFGVFGERVRNVNEAWKTCILRAHGLQPTWTKHGKLAEESRAALKAIDLRFYDLRHEAGSRWLEAGWPIHHVKEMLGHANISQTDTYLNAGRMGLHDQMRRFEQIGIPQTGIRCTSVVRNPSIEHRLVSNAVEPDDANTLLH